MWNKNYVKMKLDWLCDEIIIMIWCRLIWNLCECKDEFYFFFIFMWKFFKWIYVK